eukprot:5323044-Prymnesium_polylepis.1
MRSGLTRRHGIFGLCFMTEFWRSAIKRVEVIAGSCSLHGEVYSLRIARNPESGAISIPTPPLPHTASHTSYRSVHLWSAYRDSVIRDRKERAKGYPSAPSTQ